jgi:hypothetical protein
MRLRKRTPSKEAHATPRLAVLARTDDSAWTAQEKHAKREQAGGSPPSEVYP